MQQQLKYVDYIWNLLKIEEQYIGATKIKDLDNFLEKNGFSSWYILE